MHREIYRRKERKGSPDGRALQRGQSCTGDFDLYNTKKGKNEFYRR
jgi:hypothetical protein